MIGQNDVGAVTDHQTYRADALQLKASELFYQQYGIDNHTVADHAQCVWMNDTGRNKMQLELPSVDHYGVSGVATALIANDYLSALSQEIGYFSLAFVSPLGSHNNNRWHGLNRPPRMRVTTAALKQAMSDCGSILSTA